MNDPAEWVMDVYLHTNVSKEEVFRLLLRAGLGAPEPVFALQGESLEIDIGGNPDKTGDSPFGYAPLLLGVAKPRLASKTDFEVAVQHLFATLTGAGILYNAVSKDED